MTPQVLLDPCQQLYDSEWEDDKPGWSEDDPEWEEDVTDSEEERFPQPKCAVGVDVICQERISDRHPLSAFALLKPELGSALGEAALRAFDTLDRGPAWRYV